MREPELQPFYCYTTEMCVHNLAIEVLVMLCGTTVSLHLPTAVYASSVTPKMEAANLGYNDRGML